MGFSPVPHPQRAARCARRGAALCCGWEAPSGSRSAARGALARAARSTRLGKRRRAARTPGSRSRTRGTGLRRKRGRAAGSEEQLARLPGTGCGKTAVLSNGGPHNPPWGCLQRCRCSLARRRRPWLGWGLGESLFSMAFLQTTPRLASVLRLPGERAEARVRWECARAARGSCRSPVAGCPRKPRRCRSPAPARGHGTGPREPGVPPQGPRTAAAVTPTRSHISHTNRSLRQVLIQFVAVSITTSQRFLVLSVATRKPSFGV